MSYRPMLQPRRSAPVSRCLRNRVASSFSRRGSRAPAQKRKSQAAGPLLFLQQVAHSGSRQIPRRRPVSTMSQPKALLPLPLGAVARLVARAGRAIYVGNRAALHDPARLAALFQRSDDLHRASSEGERREEGGDRGRDCLLQQHWRQSGGPPPKTQAEHRAAPRVETSLRGRVRSERRQRGEFTHTTKVRGKNGRNGAFELDVPTPGRASYDTHRAGTHITHRAGTHI